MQVEQRCGVVIDIRNHAGDWFRRLSPPYAIGDDCAGDGGKGLGQKGKVLTSPLRVPCALCVWLSGIRGLSARSNAVTCGLAAATVCGPLVALSSGRGMAVLPRRLAVSQVRHGIF